MTPDTSPPGERALRGVEGLLSGDHAAERRALDTRYAALDEVLDGRRAAVVYPAARLGRHAAAGLRARGADVAAFGDRDPERAGQELDGLPVLTPAEVAREHADDVVLVATTLYDSAVREELAGLGCSSIVPVGYLNLRLPDLFPAREYDGAWQAAADPANRPDIIAALSLLADDKSRRMFANRLGFYLSLDKRRLTEVRSGGRMYFDEGVYRLTGGEVVADGGAYTGDTLESFVAASGNRFRGYVAFEPDAASFRVLAHRAAADPRRVAVVEAGLSDSTGRRRLSGTATADSRVLDEDELGGAVIDVISLDDYFRDRPSPTIVKLDIEGEEAAALRGGAAILRTERPILAVSAYHRPTDLWTLPLLIERLMPGSNLHFRCYGEEIDNAVCYAIPRA